MIRFLLGRQPFDLGGLGLLTLGLVGNGVGLARSRPNGGLSWHVGEASCGWWFRPFCWSAA